jgi:hypothetical protein
MPVSLETLRTSLGFTRQELPDDASDDQINALLRKRASTMSHQRFTAADGHAAISKAIAERKIPEDRRGYYEVEFSRNPEGTIALLERLESAPVSLYASGHSPQEEPDESYPAGWLNETERKTIAAAQVSEAPRVVIEQ